MRWMWIDRVIELVPRQRMVAVKNVSLAEEHLHQHFAADAARGLAAMPVMPACFVIEGMAQTGGILVGHAEDFKFNVVLAKINRVELLLDATPGCTIKHHAELERFDDLGASVRGSITLLDHAKPDRGWQPMGSIDLMFSHLDNSQGGAGQAGSDFPAHNFVFGEGFKTLLRSSGY
jgi:3-hydroxyacyl-[acyl-carrier-protein] dehydratase